MNRHVPGSGLGCSVLSFSPGVVPIEEGYVVSGGFTVVVKTGSSPTPKQERYCHLGRSPGSFPQKTEV